MASMMALLPTTPASSFATKVRGPSAAPRTAPCPRRVLGVGLPSRVCTASRRKDTSGASSPFSNSSDNGNSSNASSNISNGSSSSSSSGGAAEVSLSRLPSGGGGGGVVDEAAPFMEPLLRNLVIGLGAGAMAELLHVAYVALTSGGLPDGGAMWGPAGAAAAAGLLSPLYVFDHVVAVAVWALLYLVEARTVSRIIQDHPGAPDKAANTIRSTMTLPKRLMPLSLSSLKRAVHSWVNGTPNAAVVAAASNASGILDVPRQGSSSGLVRKDSAGSTTEGTYRSPLERAASDAMMMARAGSASVLDRPPVVQEEVEAISSDEDIDDHKASGAANSIVSAPARVPAAASKPACRTTDSRSHLAGGNILKPLKPTPLTGDKRARELKERSSYLKNFWYAAALSQNIKPGQTLEVKMLGRTVVLFRDEQGSVRCLDNVCPHRGAPLGQGWVQEVQGHTCVVCPYHGWAFDGQGKLRDVPSSADRTHLPRRALVDAYPVEERGGFVWLFFGSSSMPAEERPPIPVVPELEDPNWQAVYGELEFDCPHWSVFDNALDMAHIHYLHESSFGNQDKPEIMDMEVERDTFGIKGSFRIHNKPVNPLWNWSKVEAVPVEVKAFLPSTSYVKITLARGVQMITFVNTVPIDAHRSVNRFCLIRNFAGWQGFDGFARKSMFNILGEDKVMVEQLTPEAMRAEVSLEADLPQIAFRRLRQEWVNMGYAVEPTTTEGYAGSLDL